MPQLNPAPWLFTFIITWIITLTLLKSMTALQYPATPTKTIFSRLPLNWSWL